MKCNLTKSLCHFVINSPILNVLSKITFLRMYYLKIERFLHFSCWHLNHSVSRCVITARDWETWLQKYKKNGDVRDGARHKSTLPPWRVGIDWDNIGEHTGCIIHYIGTVSPRCDASLDACRICSARLLDSNPGLKNIQPNCNQATLGARMRWIDWRDCFVWVFGGA